MQDGKIHRLTTQNWRNPVTTSTADQGGIVQEKRFYKVKILRKKERERERERDQNMVLNLLRYHHRDK